MLQFDFDNSIAHCVCMTAHCCVRTLTRKLAPLGLTAQHARILYRLHRQGEMSQTQLADALQIENATLSGILRRMERMGWTCRVPCGRDRRRKLVRETAKAQRLWQKLCESFRAVETLAIANISETELNKIKGLLKRIGTNLRLN
ncbi:MAG: MarR family transcriptional regulator [Planctomycetes bacterium]|nr:MarR family transcriptional regulator [Planctomycetota bacterium]